MRHLIFSLFMLITLPTLGTDALPPAMQKIENLGNTVTALGKVYGLRSYVVERPEADATQIFYVTPDGQAAIAGIMHDANGLDVTRSQLMKFLKIQSAPTSDMIWKNSLHYGSTGPLLMAFLSPTCDVCTRFWKDVGPQIVKGNLQVLVLLVASGNDQPNVQRSKVIAASILGTDTPADTFVRVSLSQNITALKAPKSSNLREIEQNQGLFTAMAFDKTPAFLAQLPTGQLIKASGWPILIKNLLPKYNPN